MQGYFDKYGLPTRKSSDEKHWKGVSGAKIGGWLQIRIWRDAISEDTKPYFEVEKGISIQPIDEKTQLREMRRQYDENEDAIFDSPAGKHEEVFGIGAYEPAPNFQRPFAELTIKVVPKGKDAQIENRDKPVRTAK